MFMIIIYTGNLPLYHKKVNSLETSHPETICKLRIRLFMTVKTNKDDTVHQIVLNEIS